MIGVTPKLIILIGIQGSGKSNWSNKYTNYYRVCPDEIRKKYYGGVHNQIDNTSIHTMARGMVIAALELNQNTILDGTNLNTPFRRELFKRLPLHERHARIFKIEPEIAIQRIKKDIKNGVDRANVPDRSVYRYYGDYLHTMKVITEEGYESIETIDQSLIPLSTYP